MHEYAVTKSIVDIAVSEAKRAGSGRITGITLVIGDLSSIFDESVGMYFDIISKGTIAEGAKLVFKRVPVRFRCKMCGYEYDKPDKGFDCTFCGGSGKLTGAGKEFYIESMEVDE